MPTPMRPAAQPLSVAPSRSPGRASVTTFGHGSALAILKRSGHCGTVKRTGCRANLSLWVVRCREASSRADGRGSGRAHRKSDLWSRKPISRLRAIKGRYQRSQVHLYWHGGLAGHGMLPLRKQMNPAPFFSSSRTRYSATVTPEPPISFGTSIIFGNPSLIRSFVS